MGIHTLLVLVQYLVLGEVLYSSTAQQSSTDCTFTRLGTSYTGSTSTTRSGRRCQSWSSQSPHPHPYTQQEQFPDTSPGGSSNYCRNPAGARSGLWCYTTDGSTEWEYCDVPQCDCVTSRSGYSYAGTRQVTVTGRACQLWSSQTPHAHDYTDASYFPDDTLGGASNYCRNPDSEWHGSTWCFTTDPAVRWEQCDVPVCECRPDVSGATYRGQTAVTSSGIPCQRWDSNTPHPHNHNDGAQYPEGDVSKAQNYCRNPDNALSEGAWCLTTDPDTRWAYCNIPLCEFWQAAVPTVSPVQYTTPYSGVVPAPRTVRQNERVVVQECRFSVRGTAYAGRTSRTASGKTCQRWDAQTPHRHSYTNTDRFPDSTLSDAGNFCRNPGNHALGPWCYTTTGTASWEYCDIPVCHCKTTEAGSGYTGNIHRTVSGKPCQSWTSQSPHTHSYTAAAFPDNTLEEVRNYCRNPDGEHPEGPWCLTLEAATRWEYCDVPYCECKPDVAGLMYSGQRSVTVSGNTCQRWDQQSPQPHNYNTAVFFPDSSVSATENYCRNPDKGEGGGPWCYTTEPGVRWGYCDVRLCELPHETQVQNVPVGAQSTPAPATDCVDDALGLSYTGTVSVTVSGRTCQSWSLQSPQQHTYRDAAMFPDAAIADAGNACRNIEADSGGPWCFTTDPTVRWEYCSIPICIGKPKVPETTKKPVTLDTIVYECRRSDAGSEYRGTQSRTVSGLTCARWSDQAQRTLPHTDPASFPDATLQDAANSCRNPSSSRDAPWCYTTEPNTPWEYCNIPDCGCKKEVHGRGYNGTVHVTATGKTCQAWSSQQPQQHDFTDGGVFPGGSLAAAGSFCRNPDPTENSGPWCFTTDPGVRWEYCDVPACDCLVSPTGVEYVGPRAVTLDGLPCQPWSSQSPHPHDFTDPQTFPDLTLEDAASSCRNPRAEREKTERPWCFTTNPTVRWGYCDIPACNPPPPAPTVINLPVVTVKPTECLQSVSGSDYRGTRSTTQSGRTCQAWASQVPQPHSYTNANYFPDDTLGGASNYCRNPDQEETGGVWCYTTSASVRWEYCDVPLCNDVIQPTPPSAAPSVTKRVTQRAPATPRPVVPSGVVPVRTEAVSTPTVTTVTTVNPPTVRECKLDKLGASYTGRQDVTRSGQRCQRWDTQTPHVHPHSDVSSYPDTRLQDAGAACRNPGSWHPQGPWCYTQDPDVQWEYCNIPFCDCKSTPGGHEYGGHMAVTSSGIPCQRWAAQTPHAHRHYGVEWFPEGSVEGAGNYCRNPDVAVGGGPWCYTTDVDKLWEYCDIPLCEGITVTEAPGAASVGEVKDSSLPAGSLAAIVLGTLLLIMLVFIVIFFIRYRAHLPALKAHNDSTDPTKELGLSFYNNKATSQQHVLYLDRDPQQVEDDCLTRMPTNEYMTIPAATSGSHDVYELPITVM